MRHPGKYRRHRLDCHDLKIIHDLVAKKLSTVNGLTSDDLRDIEHDVVLVLLRRMEKFDPAINKWAAFRAVVIYHTLTDIIRKHVGPDSEINRAPISLWMTAFPEASRTAPCFIVIWSTAT